MFYRIILIAFLIALSTESKLFSSEDKVYGGYTNCTSYLYDFKAGKLDIASKRANEVITYDTKGNKIGYMQFYAEKPTDTYCCKNPARGNEYEEYNDFKSGEKYIKKSYKYDNKNNMIEEKEFNPNGSIIEQSKYKYDEKSREIEKTLYISDSIIKEIHKTKYVSEDNSSESEISFYNLDGSIHEWRQIRSDADGNNQLKQIRIYSPNGKIINDYLYNSDGTIFDILNPDPKGNYNPLYMDIDYINRQGGIVGAENFYKTTYELDENGRIKTVLKFSSETVVDVKCTYKYDEFGNTIERVAYKDDAPIFKTEYIYTK